MKSKNKEGPLPKYKVGDIIANIHFKAIYKFKYFTIIEVLDKEYELLVGDGVCFYYDRDFIDNNKSFKKLNKIEQLLYIK